MTGLLEILQAYLPAASATLPAYPASSIGNTAGHAAVNGIHALQQKSSSLVSHSLYAVQAPRCFGKHWSGKSDAIKLNIKALQGYHMT